MNVNLLRSVLGWGGVMAAALAVACQSRTKASKESEENEHKLATCLDDFAKVKLEYEKNRGPYYSTSYCFSALNTAQFLKFLSRAQLHQDRKNAAIEKYIQLHGPILDWDRDMIPLLSRLEEWVIDPNTIMPFRGESVDHHMSRPEVVQNLDRTKLYREETYQRVMDGYLSARISTLLPNQVYFYARQSPTPAGGNLFIKRYAEAMQQAGKLDWKMVEVLNRALLEDDSPGYDWDTDTMNTFLVRAFVEPRMDNLTPAEFLRYASLVRKTEDFNMLVKDYEARLVAQSRNNWEAVELLTANLRESHATSYQWDSDSLNDQMIMHHVQSREEQLTTDQFLQLTRGVRSPVFFNSLCTEFARAKRDRIPEGDRPKLLAALRTSPSFMGSENDRSAFAARIESIFSGRE